MIFLFYNYDKRSSLEKAYENEYNINGKYVFSSE